MPPFAGSALLQVLGALILGAGLSAFIGGVAGREATHQQSAKEANLARKRETYGPLYAELKALHEAFSEAHSGAAPAPQWIDNGTEPQGLVPVPGPTFKLWYEFRRDYRYTDFSSRGRFA